MRNRRFLMVGLTTAGLLFSSVALSARAPRPVALYTTTHSAMGTVFTLCLYSADAETAATESDVVFEEVDRIEQLLSNYRGSSELSRINAKAADAPVTTDPEMMDFLQQSQYWSRASDGAFDITVGRLMKAWGFYRHQGRIPTQDELLQLRSVTGWQKVELEPSERTVHFASLGIELDPGGIGKGFAVDAAVRILRADHVHAAMLSAGGSTIYALGSPPGKPGWRVVVPGPLPSAGTLSVVTLRDTSLSSSDCTQKNFTVAGHLYCHIMDPHTMMPVKDRTQVSVIDPSATASDALSNVLFVLTPPQSLETLQRYAPLAHALIVSSENGSPHCTNYEWAGEISASRCPPTTPNPNGAH
jgi:thiamine biosynthesis lipoprotein